MGTHVMSTDEKTGMQALERLHATKPVRPGLVERVEFEYVRHGTLSVIANFDVATGKVVSPSIGPTRTEADFVAHIDQTIETDPEAGWIFVTDQLDTHRAATLVELVARRCGIQDDLGNITTFVRDIMGRVLAQVSPLGARTSYNYDVNGRKIVTIKKT